MCEQLVLNKIKNWGGTKSKLSGISHLKEKGHFRLQRALPLDNLKVNRKLLKGHRGRLNLWVRSKTFFFLPAAKKKNGTGLK